MLGMFNMLVIFPYFKKAANETMEILKTENLIRKQQADIKKKHSNEIKRLLEKK